MNISDTPAPLSSHELDTLEILLGSDVFRGEAMLPDELQGFFFAIASAPEPIPPEAWLPEALGDKPAYENDEQAQETLALVTRFYHQCIDDAASGDFELLLYRTEAEEPDYEAWCGGYLTGVDLAETDWYEAGDPEEIGELLFPLLVLADALPDDEKRRVKPAEWRRLVRSCADSLPDTVAQIHAYWQALGNPPATVRREVPKTGRNEPCPCGSGKKFKQCCGSPGVLH